MLGCCRSVHGTGLCVWVFACYIRRIYYKVLASNYYILRELISGQPHAFFSLSSALVEVVSFYFCNRVWVWGKLAYISLLTRKRWPKKSKNTTSVQFHPRDSVLHTNVWWWECCAWTEGESWRTKSGVQGWKENRKHGDWHVNSEYRAPNQHSALRNTWMF